MSRRHGSGPCHHTVRNSWQVELLLILAVISFYSAKRSRSPFAEGLRKGWDKLREASRGVAEEISTRDYE
jgi:hypothetical protein